MCERNIDQLLLECPQLGTWPTTQVSALTRNQTHDFQVCRMMPNPLSHTGQGDIYVFKIVCLLTQMDLRQWSTAK